MKFKIGNDIIETERIKNLCEKYGDKFKTRVYTNNEIKYCEVKVLINISHLQEDLLQKKRFLKLFHQH